MNERIWNDSDDANYWAAQDAALAEPVDPIVALEGAERRLDSISGSSDPALIARRAELTADVARLRASVDAITAPAQAAYEAEWTRETTIARRAAWNDAVRSGQYTRNGTLHVASLVSNMGFGVDDLRAAVARHGL